MNWSRNKNSSEEKAVNGEIYCMLGFRGGNLNNELESRQELFGRASCEWINLLHVEKAVNGEIYCMFSFGGGSLNNELES